MTLRQRLRCVDTFAPTRHKITINSHPSGADVGARKMGNAAISYGSTASRKNNAGIDQIEAGRPRPREFCNGVVALGNFDGFHLGHQAVVHRAVELARARGVAAIVATFDPHPVRYFRPSASPFFLTTLDQRRRLAAEAGADALLVFRFNEELAGVTPEHFVEKWLADVSAIVTGSDFAFGRDRVGNVHSLAELGMKRGLTSCAVMPVMMAGRVVSSSRIREALQSGDCEAATRLLTRPYAIEGALNLPEERPPDFGFTKASINLGAYLSPGSGTYTVRIRRASGVCQKGFAHLGLPNVEELPNSELELFLTRTAGWSHREPIEVSFLRKTSADVVVGYQA